MFFVAVFGDRHALHQLHDEVGPAAVGRARVEHLGDVRVVHHRQRLPLGLEAGDHLPGVHARLDDLQRDGPLDRLGLLGHEHDAHAAFADLLQELVGADDRAGPLGDGVGDGAVDPFFTRLQKRSKSPRVVQQLFHFLAQLRIRTALRFHVSCSFPLRGNFEGIQEKALCLVFRIGHEAGSPMVSV